MNGWHQVKRIGQMILLLVFTALGMAAAQQGPTAGTAATTGLLAHSKQFLPGAEFDRWYDEVLTACQKRHECATPAADFGAITWYAYQGEAIPCGTERCDGQTLVGPNLIFLSRRAMYDVRAIKHEMLHAILGRGDHPVTFVFLGLGDR